jgi:multicomponent Na+:H+ antiporter subunit G
MNTLMLFGKIFMVLGTVFAFAMTLGMIRFPDAYTRLHAGTKGLTIGAGLIVLGAAFHAPSWGIGIRMVIVAIFFMLTNPISTQAIGRAAYRIRAARRQLVVDEYAEAVNQIQDTADDYGD